MGTKVIIARFGVAAQDALAAALDRAADPLAPALVVCPSPLVAVGVRRALGARPEGVAGVDVMTVERVVEELSQPALAEVGQHPAGSLEMQAAIRSVLGAEPGLFGAVATHRTTEERLLQLDAELVGLPRDDQRRLMSTPGLTGDAFRVLEEAADRLGPARVRSHVVQLAVEAIETLALGARGRIVVYLPEPTRPSEARVLAALARRAEATVIVGFTGHPHVDTRHLQLLAGSGLPVAGLTPAEAHETESDPPDGRVLEVADPEDEVRAALREIVSWAASGTPLARMALLYSAVDPYASLIEEALVAAELPFSAPGHRPLSSSLAGRSLRRLLQLVPKPLLAADGAKRPSKRGSGLERSAVITLISSAPIVTPSGQLAMASAWDRLSRQAGVVDGDDWIPRITKMAQHLSSESDRGAATGLLEFIEDLQQRLRPATDHLSADSRSWEGWSRWAGDLLLSLLRTSRWPDRELVALERVQGVLEQLRTLDAFDPQPTFDSFVATVLGELERVAVPGRPAGAGLLVAPVGAVTGLVFERVAVVGISEGVFPRAGREDSLLPDQVRAQAGGWLLPRSVGPHLDDRALSAVVAAARNRPLLTTARGDLRSRRSKVWPRQLDHLVAEVVVLESHHRGLVDHGRPASLQDVGLRSLVRHTDGGDPVHTHRLAMDDDVLAAGLGRHLDRNRSELTAHTGRVRSGLIDPTTRPLSATALEDYASCPRKYLFGRVFRLGDEEAPERIEEISPRERGTLVHEILERFLAQHIEAGTVPRPDQSWDGAAQMQLLELLDDAIQEAADLGITGGRVQTEILRRQLRNEALSFLVLDNQVRADARSTPAAVELQFGFDDTQPLTLSVGDSPQLVIRGVVDRVDYTDDGGLLVIDYKGGSATPFRGIERDPLKGGTRLQLPLYARVLAHQLDRHGPRTALYWLTKSGEVCEMPLSDEVEAELDDHVGAAITGIKDGLFPGIPGETVGWPRLTFENCKFCDFDRICPTDRQRERDGVADDPDLTPIDLLLGRQRKLADAAELTTDTPSPSGDPA